MKNLSFRSPSVYIFCLIIFANSKAVGQSQGTGLIFLSDNEYKSIPLASTAMMGSLPSSKDLSLWFPRPGNQGGQSSCVAWAVCYGLKSYQEAVERKQHPTANSQTFSPAYIYNQIKLGGCGGGSYIKTALNLLKQEGVTPLNQFPYDENSCSQMPTSSDKVLARQYAIAEWRTVPLETEVDVKSHIASGFPVVIGMLIDDGFARIMGRSIYSGPSGQEKGGHAMVVVGYDDNLQAFKVLNSWGTSWGEGGFGWISYSAFKRRVREAYSAQDIVISDPANIIKPLPSNNDPIPNIPVPVPSPNIQATLSSLTIIHNVTINTNAGLHSGMSISVPGSLINAAGSNAQIIIRFLMPNGQPLIANNQEFFFRDIHGFVAVGSPVMPVVNNPAPTGNATFNIPYYALNLIPTNGTRAYQLNAIATLYINNFEKAKSPVTLMTVRY